jgi:hypothetical protein
MALNPWMQHEKISKFRELLKKGWSMSPLYRVRVRVKEVKENCTMNYKPGDSFTVERFYVSDARKGICIHAPVQMLTLSSYPKECYQELLM